MHTSKCARWDVSTLWPNCAQLPTTECRDAPGPHVNSVSIHCRGELSMRRTLKNLKIPRLDVDKGRRMTTEGPESSAFGTATPLLRIRSISNGFKLRRLCGTNVIPSLKHSAIWAYEYHLESSLIPFLFLCFW